MIQRQIGVLNLAGFMVLMIFACPALAQDWPQILGPNRNGTLPDAPALTTEWPASMQPVWKVTLGSGYGGAAIADSKVFVMHRQGDQELLAALELESGRRLWQTGWPATYQTSMNPDDGPRCVPCLKGDKAICYGAAGALSCVRITDGKLLWSRSLRAEYDADDGYFGAGASPLILNDLAIVCLGGKEAGIVAVDLESGKTRWTATNFDASYASPIAVGAPGSSTILVVTRLNAVLLDGTDGSLLSDVRFGARGPTVNAATPIAIGTNQVLLTASYGVGASLLKIADRKLIEVFRGSEILSSQYNTPIYVAKRVIGIDGREDIGVASLRAIDVAAQKVLWDKPGMGASHLIGLGNQVLVLSLNGKLTLIDGSAATYQPLASTQLSGGTYRALPAWSGRRLVVRATVGSNAQATQLQCIELP